MSKPGNTELTPPLVDSAEIPRELLDSLNTRQIQFCYELVKHGVNKSGKAAEAVGYSKQYGYKLLNNPNVRALFAAICNQNSFVDVASYSEVLQRLTSIARGEEREEFYDMKRSKIVPLTAPIKERRAALETLAKFHGILHDGNSRLDVTLKETQIVVDIEGFDEGGDLITIDHEEVK
ncbi:terminase small subunit [Bacillus sp. JJ1127]|uniref:terminase small subunit n=1 Tax=Bacillus sp. JJ1127 TaxID=3122952 RepID=UPI002FFE41CD